MSVMFTLISTRPIFSSSGVSEFCTLSRNLSRLRLMSSIVIEAITWRSWPRMMSSACFITWRGSRPSRRMAAVCMTAASVPTATVNTDGTLTRMFSADKAPRSGISICIGSSERNAKSWISGHTNAPPPCRQRADWPDATLPKMTRMRLLGQRL